MAALPRENHTGEQTHVRQMRTPEIRMGLARPGIPDIFLQHLETIRGQIVCRIFKPKARRNKRTLVTALGPTVTQVSHDSDMTPADAYRQTIQ